MTPAEARFKRIVFWLEDAGVPATGGRILTALGSRRAARGRIDWEQEPKHWMGGVYYDVEPGGPLLDGRETKWRREAREY